MANDSISNKLWSACNKMRQDPGTTGALQYVEQFSWLLFLKVYEETENKNEAKAAFEGETYQRNIDGEYRWSVWTGKDTYLTGPGLLGFVQNKLIPHLRKLSGNRTKEIISEIFTNTQNRMEDGYLLREVIDVMAGLDFFSDEDSFAVSSIYEGLFSRMKSAEIKPLAEFHTPRVIARFMTEMVAPKIGQTIYDPCNGPSGFLTEAYHFMRPKAKNVADNEKLQKETFYGKELKSLPFILGTMNMILNGIATPNIRKMNTLSINLFNLTEKYDIILTNPPFSGTVRGIDSNFPYPSAQTEILFLQHCMRSLKEGGKCAIIFPEGVLFENNDQSYVNTKKELLQQFNLHHIVRLPNGAFAPYTGIPTNILFFDKTGPTKEIRYHELSVPKNRKNFSKSRPIRPESFSECIKDWSIKILSGSSWIVSAEEVIGNNYNLDIKNPNQKKGLEFESPEKLLSETRNASNALSSLIDDLGKKISFQVSRSKKETLGDWLKQYRNTTRINDASIYKQITISQSGNVLFRGEKPGSEIGRKRQFIVDLKKHPRTLIFIRQGVQGGGIGIIPPELDESVVTENMPVFDIRKDIDDRFLRYYLRSPLFKNEVEKIVPKGAAQKAIHEDKLLKIPVYCLTPNDQAEFLKIIEIFERVSELADKIKETTSPLIKSFYHHKLSNNPNDLM